MAEQEVRAARRDRTADRDRQLTFTERARREQILRAAIELTAEVGSASTSLARIAERAGISKAAVLYHFENKDQLMRLALDAVFDGLSTSIGEDVLAAPTPGAQVATYVRSLVGYVQAHPADVRFMVEAMAKEELAGRRDGSADRPLRWQPVADLLAEGQRRGEFRPFDTRVVAVWIGGAIDGLFAEWMEDRRFDLDAAVDELVVGIDLAIRRASTPSA